MGCLCGEGIVKPTIVAIRPHTTLAKYVVSDILSGGLLIGGCLIDHYELESLQFPSQKNISDCLIVHYILIGWTAREFLVDGSIMR